ncbi:MAG: glycosyl transferase family 1, partial [Prevotellaceae bacterium]|nr:glycosyl transferase family 1 [Prevotellaceae bacterium]
MRILIVNTSATQGGAAIAASRLMNALKSQGVDVMMLTRKKKFPAFYWERFVIWVHNRFSRKNLFTVSIANAGIDITQTEAFRRADIVHLHWVNQGFLSLDTLQKIFHSG